MIKSLQVMNKFQKLGLLALLVSLFSVLDAGAQGFNAKYRYWSYGVTMNAINYVGDVDPGPSILSPGIKFTRYNFGAVVMRRLGARVSARGTFSYGRVAGNDFVNSKYTTKGGDIFRKARNLSFFNNILELKGDVVIDFIEHRGKYQKRPDFVPYAFVGLAYFYHNPKTRANLGNGEQVYELREYSTEGQETGIADASKKYSLHQIAIPVGLGLRYKVSKQIDLAVEIGWRFTFTDYIDDVGGKFVDKAELYAAKGRDAVLLSDRSWEAYENDLVDGIPTNFGGMTSYYDSSTAKTFISVGGPPDGNARSKTSNRSDAYIVTGLHLMYIIPTKVICPKFR